MLRCMRIFGYALAGLLALSLAGAGCWVTPVKAAPPAQAPNPIGPNTIYMPLIATPTPYAIYRSGQTFLSWPERWDLQGELYTIYRSSQPITSADDLKNAVKLASVGKNSANFYANRYCTVSNSCGNPPNANWMPRYIDRYMIQDGGPQIPGSWGLLVWTLAADDFSGGTVGDGYYTITVTPAGGTETYNQGSSIGPIAEAIADPRPVEMTSPGGINIGAGGHAYIQFMDLRHWNPTFHAPNPTNQYFGVDPADPSLKYDLQYAYDYDVFTPSASLCPGNSLPASLPVFVHLHGHKDNTKGGEGGYPDAYCAYGIYPFDDTDTWYFGFASKNDYRSGSLPGPGDVIANYTEQRVLRMIYDLEKNPPGPAVDVQRIYVAGQSMGGTGSLAFAERYPNVFAAAYASQPMTNFRTAGTAYNTGPNWVDDASVKWGSPQDNLPVSISAPNGWADGLQNLAKTMGVWDWEDLQARAADPRQKEMALIGVTHGTGDEVVWYNTQGAPTYADLDAGNRIWGGLVNGATHLWQYYNGLPPEAAKNSKYIPFWGLSVKRDETKPGISGLSGNRTASSTQTGIYNQTVKWSSSWDPWDGSPIDTASRWQMSFCAVQNGSTACETGSYQTANITLKQVQHFVVTPGARYYWRNLRKSDNAVYSQGYATAEGSGLLTIPNVGIYPYGNRLVVTPG